MLRMGRRAQALVETVLILPILASAVFGGLTMQRVYGHNAVLNQAASASARMGGRWAGDTFDAVSNSYPMRVQITTQLATIGIPSGSITFCDSPSVCGNPSAPNTATADLPAACTVNCYGTTMTVTVRLYEQLISPWVWDNVGVVLSQPVSFVVDKY